MTTEQHDGTVLSAIAPLREAGFALHWLHPRKKRPIGARWQDAAVASLEDLRRSHAPGNNLGVRLGEPSLTAAGYLHVLDADIRIPELADEAWATLERLLPGARATLPTVASGSGGESRHLHFVTDKPFRSRVIAHSEGKHRREVVDPETGEVKTKWSYDWEIELFGTGKQVALPPSIHPDTGKPYVWLREFDFTLLDLGMGPHIPAATLEALGVAEDTVYEFETREPLTFKPGQMERDLDAIDISDLHYDDWVRLGQALHHQFGGSQEGFDIWLRYTKTSKKFTGDAQEREMRRIKWRSFGKYRGKPVTMGTVRVWAQEARAAAMADAFDDLDDEEEDDDTDLDLDGSETVDDLFAEMLGSAAAPKPETPKKAHDPLSDDPEAPEPGVRATVDWEQLLDYNEEGAIKPTLHNVEMIIRNDVRLVGLPQLNEFTQETVQRTPPGQKARKKRASAKQARQLEGRVWEIRDKLNGEIWSSARDYAIRSILEAPKTQGGYGIKVTDRDLKASIVLAAWDNSFHPVREYLGGLTWDGVSRIETLFMDYLGAEDNTYNRHVARLMMVAGVARVFEPGHKWDFAVILEGLQGRGKSTFIRTLGKRWFAELEGDFHDGKEMVEKMQGAWIMEIPELSGFNRADVRSIKAFISRQVDKVRLAYEARAQEFPRQCILIGSTNDREYLKDDTGGRRFFPMACKASMIDIPSLRKNVDQLWAEAYAIYQAMRAEQPEDDLPLYLMDPDAAAEAARLQESRRVESADDGLAGTIGAWLDRPASSGGFDDEPGAKAAPRNVTCLKQIWAECFGGDLKNYTQANAQSIGRAMRLIKGWTSDGEYHEFPSPYGRQRCYERTGSLGRFTPK